MLLLGFPTRTDLSEQNFILVSRWSWFLPRAPLPQFGKAALGAAWTECSEVTSAFSFAISVETLRKSVSSCRGSSMKCSEQAHAPRTWSAAGGILREAFGKLNRRDIVGGSRSLGDMHLWK